MIINKTITFLLGIGSIIILGMSLYTMVCVWYLPKIYKLLDELYDLIKEDK
jgi:hypothetical protein